MLFRSIDVPAIRELFGRSTVGLAPFRGIENYERNVPNKIHDYLSSGLPVVTPLGGVTRELLDSLGVAGRCEPGDPKSFARALAECRGSGPARQQLRERHRARFDPTSAYGDVVDRLEAIAAGRPIPRARTSQS